MDVRASALKAAIFADRPAECRSAVKIVDYAPQVLCGSSATNIEDKVRRILPKIVSFGSLIALNSIRQAR
jgi:hypothetical protein